MKRKEKLSYMTQKECILYRDIVEHLFTQLRKNKEERERLETSLKREKEKTKQLRAVVTAAQGATSGKKR